MCVVVGVDGGHIREAARPCAGFSFTEKIIMPICMPDQCRNAADIGEFQNLLTSAMAGLVGAARARAHTAATRRAARSPG